MQLPRHYRPAMRWSFRIARVTGIDVRVHVSVALALIYFALSLELRGARGFLFGGLLIVSMLLCLTLHELGHWWVAQHFGADLREILLLPIGGVARLTREARKPHHELLIALAGPAVNLLIALLLLLPLAHVHASFDWSDWGRISEPSALAFAQALFLGNVVLSLFNLLPALPMDGGRAFRALISMVIGRSRATRLAAVVGQLIALCLIAIAIKKDSGPLALLALFVFVGAAQERALERANGLLSELRAGEVCDPNAVAFSPHDQIGHVLDTLVRSSQAHFAVFYGKELVGTIAREQVLARVPRLGLSTPLGALMRRGFHAVDAGTPLDEVRRQLHGLAGGPVVVRSLGGYSGVIGFEDLRRIMVVVERLARAGIRRPQPLPDPALH